MTKGIFIVGNESTLLKLIENEAAKRVEHFVSAVIPNRFSVQEEAALPEKSAAQPSTGEKSGLYASAERARISLPWNPGSPISARTLVLSAQNRLGHIDDAILVCNPPVVRGAIAGLDPANVEIVVNDHIKGWFYLIRELCGVLRPLNGGSLALAYLDTDAGKDDPPSPLGSSALASFRALTRSLLNTAFTEPFLIQGFASSETRDEAGFAAFIVKLAEEAAKRNNGKLHKYGKTSLFK